MPCRLSLQLPGSDIRRHSFRNQCIYQNLLSLAFVIFLSKYDFKTSWTQILQDYIRNTTPNFLKNEQNGELFGFVDVMPILPCYGDRVRRNNIDAVDWCRNVFYSVLCGWFCCCWVVGWLTAGCSAPRANAMLLTLGLSSY